MRKSKCTARLLFCNRGSFSHLWRDTQRVSIQQKEKIVNFRQYWHVAKQLDKCTDMLLNNLINDKLICIWLLSRFVTISPPLWARRLACDEMQCFLIALRHAITPYVTRSFVQNKPSATNLLDLPQVDCEMRDKESEGPPTSRLRNARQGKRGTKSRVASRLVPPAEYWI